MHMYIYTLLPVGIRVADLDNKAEPSSPFVRAAARKIGRKVGK